MNYAGKFGAEFFLDSSGLHSGGEIHTETVRATHAPQDAIVVADAQLLFNGEFKRSGADLVLSNSDRELVLHDYFKGEKHAALSSPDGAYLSGGLVKALTGHVEYAQADGNASLNNIIGHVTKLVGTATAIRNGVSIILNNGDNVEKGDVVTSGSDSTLGITFIDGTVFGLSSNARMVLNEMIYDPNGSSNSSLLSLVAGTITFVAGETAKHGDMKVDTPVATMGIRGTAVLVEIDFTVRTGQSAPDAKFQVLVEPDGTTGSYILFDKATLTPFVEVREAGHQYNISNGILTETLVPLSPEIQKLIQDLFALKFADSSDTKSFQHFTDVVIQLPLQPSQFPIGSSVAPIIPATLTFGTNTPGSAPIAPPAIVPHLPVAPTIVTSNGILIQPPGATGTAQVTGPLSFNDINPTDRPTVSVKFNSFTYQNAAAPTLSNQQLLDIQALEAALTLRANPGNGPNGVDTWTYSIPASALAFLTPGSTLTLTYNATVDNNYGPEDQTSTAPFTITIKVAGEIWSETKEIASPAPGDWNNGANWQSGVKPSPTDDVIIATDPQQSGTPFYPVTIKSAEEGGVAAFADSVTMDDLGGIAPELDNFNTLTIGSGGLHLKADSILKNFGTISISGIAEILQNAVLQNSGPLAHLTLDQGGDFKDSSSITNSGTIEIAGGTLDVEVDVANSDGTMQVDGGAGLKLADGATIIEGAVTLGAGSLLDVESAGGATLDGVRVTGTGDDSPSLINIGVATDGGSTLKLEDGASIANGFMTIGANSILDVETEGGATLDGIAVTADPTAMIEIGTTTEGSSILRLEDGASVVGGNMTIGANSKLDVETEGGATLAGVAVAGTNGESPSTIEIGVNPESGGSTLTVLDGTSFTSGKMTIGADSVLDVESELGARLDGVAVTLDQTSTVEIGVNTDGRSVLTVLDGTSFTGGKMTIAADSVLDVESPGGATLRGIGVTNAGTIQVESSALLSLTGSASVTNGIMSIAGLGTLDAGNGTTLDHVAVFGTSGLGGSAINVSGAVTFQGGTALNGGKMSIAEGSTLDIENPVTGTGASLNGVDVVNSGTIQVDSAGPGDTTINLLLDGGTVIDGGTLLIHVGFPIGGIEGVVEIGTGGATFDGVNVINNNELTIDPLATLTLTDNALVAGGTIDDAGTLFVASASEIKNATIDGGGNVVVTDPLTLSGVTLDDVTLSGSFTNLDTLTIDDTVTLDGATLSGGTIDDTGTLLITSASEIDNATVDGGGDVVAAETLTLDDVTLDDVTLSGSFTNADTLTIDGTVTLDGATLSGGTIDDTGTLLVTTASEIDNATIDGGGDVTVVGDNTLTFSKVTLADVTLSGSFTNLDTLTIDDTVTLNGATLSGGTMNIFGVLDSIAASTLFDVAINITGTLESTGGTLTISDPAGPSVTNSGTLEANGGELNINNEPVTNTGTLQAIDDSILRLTSTTVTNTDGTVNVGGGSTLDLIRTEIDNGTLTNSGMTNSSGTSTLSDVAITNTGTLESTSGTLKIDATVAGPAVVNLNLLEASGGELDITNEPVTNAGTLQAIGDSILKLTSTTVNNTFGVVHVELGSTLDSIGAEIDNGILTNDGTFDSTGASALFNVAIVNTGTMESTGGTLTISDTADPSVINFGTLEANGGELDITNEPVTNEGTLQAINGSTLKLTSTTVTNTFGTVNVEFGSTMDLVGAEIDTGTFTNSGTTSSTGTSTLSDVGMTNTGTLRAIDDSILSLISTTVTNTGGAVHVESGSTLNFIGSEIDNGALTNDGTFDSTGISKLSDVGITNTGTIESTGGALTVTDPAGPSLINSGTLEANGGELDITNEPVTNTGTLQAIDDSTLKLTSTTVTNTNGIVHVEFGSTLDLASAEIDNGILTNSGTTNSTGGTSTLSDIAITNTGALQALDDSILKLTSTTVTNTNGNVFVEFGSTLDFIGGEIDNGSLTNGGTFNLSGTSTLSDVTITNDFTFNSSGTSTLSNDGIFNVGILESTSGTLMIETTVAGPTVVNFGTLEANGGELDITNEPVTNRGTLQAIDSSLLKLTSTTVTNTNGTVNVGLGSTLDLAGAEIDSGALTNSGTTNSTGASTLSDVAITNTGTLESTGGTLTISDPSGPSVTNFGIMEADGGELDITNELVTNNLALQATKDSTLKLTSTVVTNAATGFVNVDGGSTLDLINAEIDNGSLFDSGTFDSTGIGRLNNVAIDIFGTLESTGGTLTISDTAGPSVINFGTLEANGGELDITNEPVTNTGTLQAINGSTLKLTTAVVTNAFGAVNVDGTSTLDLAGAEIDNGAFTNSGTTNSSGTSTLFDVAITNAGTLESTAGKLTIDDPSGPIVNNSGTLEANGGELDITNQPVTNIGTLQAIDDSTLKLTSTTVTDTGGTVHIGLGSTLDLINAEIVNGTLTNAGALDSTGTSTLSHVSTTNTGTMESISGTFTIDGSVENDGTIKSDASTAIDITGNVTNATGSTGAIDIFANAKFEIGGTVSAGQTVTFEQSNGAGLLVLDDSHGFQGTIVGLTESPTESQENQVDLKDLAYVARHMSFTYNHGVLTVSDGSDSVTLHLSGSSSGEFEFSSDQTGATPGTLVADPSATGNVAIDSDQVLGVSAASSATITFTNTNGNTGELLLADSKDFTGTIAGFAGDGTTANSDLIDITDLNFANVALNKTAYTDNGNGTGTLTLYNASGQALDAITFAGNYQLANFTIENDGSGNTLIVDPPVSTNNQAPGSTVVASAPNQVLTGPASSDTFAFNFAAVGHATITNFDPAADALQFASSVFANAQATLNATHDDGHGNTVIAIDAHDSITLSGVVKAQLHAADFHFV